MYLIMYILIINLNIFFSCSNFKIHSNNGINEDDIPALVNEIIIILPEIFYQAENFYNKSKDHIELLSKENKENFDSIINKAGCRIANFEFLFALKNNIFFKILIDQKSFILIGSHKDANYNYHTYNNKDNLCSFEINNPTFNGKATIWSLTEYLSTYNFRSMNNNEFQCLCYGILNGLKNLYQTCVENFSKDDCIIIGSKRDGKRINYRICFFLKAEKTNFEKKIINNSYTFQKNFIGYNIISNSNFLSLERLMYNIYDRATRLKNKESYITNRRKYHLDFIKMSNKGFDKYIFTLIVKHEKMKMQDIFEYAILETLIIEMKSKINKRAKKLNDYPIILRFKSKMLMLCKKLYLILNYIHKLEACRSLKIKKEGYDKTVKYLKSYDHFIMLLERQLNII